MSSDEGTHISMAAHEIVSSIARFCELAKDQPRYAAAEYPDLNCAVWMLFDALDAAKKKAA